MLLTIFFFMLGLAIGYLFGVALSAESCEHAWDRWYDYGWTYQRRTCKKCGISKTRSNI